MDKWLKVALVAVVLVVAGSAAALPPQCEVRCTCTTSCTALCAEGGWVTNCGTSGICLGMCRSTDVVASAATQATDVDAADPLLERILGAAANADDSSSAPSDVRAD